MRAPRGILTGILLAAFLHAGCGGSSESIVPGLECSDDPPAPDTVVLRCGPALAGKARVIEVVIGLPTSPDLGTFNFDVVFDPGVLMFEAGSGTQGNLLNQDAAAVFLAVAPLEGDPGRLVVGISRNDSGEGVAGAPGRDIIMTFTLRAVPGSRFEALMPEFEHAEARDSDNVITPVAFSDQLLLSAR